MPSFFIDRPIFAWVVAILITLVGIISVLGMGVESYPNIAPPQVTVTATFPGASAQTMEDTVTKVIEQQLTGVDNLLYFSSASNSNGTSTITLSFATGTDPDIAQVQVQNKVSLAQPQLPAAVTQQGVVVAKANPDFLMFVGLISNNPEIDSNRLSDIVGSNVINQIGRIPGVGSTFQVGSEYGMRVWLNPDKMQGYGLSATQVENAISAQNVQFAAGSLGSDPAPDGQSFTATVSAEGLFNTPEQFGNIILRANPDGTVVRMKDIARIQFGPQTYGFVSTWSGQPVGGFGVQLLPGANALQVAEAVRSKMDELAKDFPQGVTWFAPYDSTPFVRVSINEVVHTLIEAIILVFFVMLIFLQNFRATVIPTLVIPVALLGTFIGLSPMGFTINQLTLFGMVLAIGIVVDDAIVVIENVERIMTEENLPPKEATRKAMSQITGAVVAITVVLAAVFVPSALQPGATGVIYKQFALTIAVSMGFSAFLALSFTPALCATILKPTHEHKKNFIYRAFNNIFDRVTHTYQGHIGSAVRHAPRWMIVFVLIAMLAGFLYTKLPTGFVPNEDQGFALAIVSLPPGASLERSEQVMKEIKDTLDHSPLKDDYVGMYQISGFSFVGRSENAGMVFIKLKDWSERSITADDFILKANGVLHGGIRDAVIFVVNLPTIRGLSQFGGLDMYLQARSGQSRAELGQAMGMLLGKASKSPTLFGTRPNILPDAPQYNLTVDRVQSGALGLSVSDVYTAIQLMLAPVYINNFIYEDRVKRVMVQADAPYRMDTDALSHIYTPSSLSTSTTSSTSSSTSTSTNSPYGPYNMIPLSSVVHSTWSMAAPSLTRYNGYPAIEIVGDANKGYSTGQAMSTLQDIVSNDLPHGFGADWTGQSYQELLAGNSATLLMILSIFIVFLCLSALYESWSIPVAVLLVVPLGLLGMVVASMLRGFPNDMYFKIGMVTVIGLAAKNAILIVEFAVEQQAEGQTLFNAVVTAARLRLRPILMTSMAFILGVLPLVTSTGAGANSRHEIGTGVIGGMLFATFLGLLLIPVFYVSVRRMLGDKMDEATHKLARHEHQ
ncbi:multidrug efflux RND transporter permease subunit [Dyella nitratireducens]|uniref:Efflux pump membrane transporter n=1 Tax=Dyella nitratireducens TaxID=1849580 RepID=A0ABQ1GMR0_9GAMM|nr:multidrug efflux RND transporter permease subunit [Dyella nitratireducens]GGA46605.1 multidrug efflux RND transporter permease subunit [Dyella nitratireducens]GLQ41471.1 multidrug efflux RND transporter permease subunit [Dyella nitratireducens]